MLEERRARLARWWHTARSTYITNQWEANGWIVFGLAGVFVRPLRESIAVIFFISCYANSKGARSTAQSARLEMREEEAEH